MDKPAKLKNEHLDFLDALRKSGATNMFGASPYLIDAYPNLKKDEAIKILSYWMETFGERHSHD